MGKIITGSINLASLQHKIEKVKNSDESIIKIPIHRNNLYLSDKGNVYLQIVAFEHEGEKQTHIVSQSLSKEKNDALKAKGEFAPTLGNLNVNGIPSAKKANSDEGNDLHY